MQTDYSAETIRDMLTQFGIWSRQGKTGKPKSYSKSVFAGYRGPFYKDDSEPQARISDLEACRVDSELSALGAANNAMYECVCGKYLHKLNYEQIAKALGVNKDHIGTYLVCAESILIDKLFVK